MLASGRVLRRPHAALRRGLCDGFTGGWTLPYRQVPWALPFAVSKAEARGAFDKWNDQGQSGAPKLKVRVVRPIHVPFYVFDGQLEVTFTGVVGYDDGDEEEARSVSPREYVHAGIRCPPTQLGADAGATTAVYAGFDFRRLYVRQALSRDLSDELLLTAVPFNELTGSPAGAGVEAFKMKPSFAYLNRILERLPEIAHHEAERHVTAGGSEPPLQPAACTSVCGHGEADARRATRLTSPSHRAQMEDTSVQALQFEGADGTRVCPHSATRHPDYERVDDVTFEYDKTARLHDRGVVLLPVWVIEYTLLGKVRRGCSSRGDRGVATGCGGWCCMVLQGGN